MSYCFRTQNEEDTVAFGARLGALLDSGSVVLLDGDLGAGKTRLSKGVAQGLGIKAELTSPTFNLVLEYPFGEGAILRHFDLYRLDDSEQLDDIDYFGLIEDERAVSLVEWGSKFDDALPLDYLSITLSTVYESSEQRQFILKAHGAHSKQILERLAAAEGLVAHD